MSNLFRLAVEFIDTSRPSAMAVVLDAEGSTPQEIGVRALIDQHGDIHGTIGGGAAEAEAQRRAMGVCGTGLPGVLDVDMTHAYSRDAGAICGGRMRVLLIPTTLKNRDAYAFAAEALAQRERGVLITRVWETGELRVAVEWIDENSASTAQSIPNADAIRLCLEEDRNRLLVPQRSSAETPSAILVEPVIPRPLLLIAGGGHVGRALAHAAAPLGFDITVVDDRPEFATPERFPACIFVRCGDITKTVADFPSGSDVYIVLVTKGHKSDAEALEACIHKPAAYIGMMGSQRKVAMIRKDFVASGIATEREFDRVFAPIGMDIGAVTVPEIAASIAAQLVAQRRAGKTPNPRREMSES